MLSMKQGKKKSNRIASVLLILLVAVVLIFVVKKFYDLITNDQSDAMEKKSEIQKLLDKDLDNSYPATPREAVKVYANIMKELYSGECSDQQIQGLYAQMRKLYDEDLLKENSYDKQFEELKKELDSYKKAKKKIVSVKLPELEDVQRGYYDGKEQALVDVTISMKEKSEWQRVTQQYVVRQDEDGRWKILGWHKIETDTGEGTDDDNK